MTDGAGVLRSAERDTGAVILAKADAEGHVLLHLPPDEGKLSEAPIYSPGKPEKLVSKPYDHSFALWWECHSPC